MSRFMHPSSVRYGNLAQWAQLGEKVETVYESREFLKYIEHLLYKEMTLDFGTIYGDSRIIYGKNSVKVSIPLYDRVFELSLKEGLINGIEETVLYDRLLVVKKLLIVEGYKYYKMGVSVEFYFFSLSSMPSVMLARYMALYLEQSQQLSEIYKHVSSELMGRGKKQDSSSTSVGSLLVHRAKSSFTSGSTLYKPRFIGDALLLGFKFDCVGRYSRKPRASRESLTIGSVSLGGFRGHVDFGAAVAIMSCGASNMRVWKYLDRYEQEWNYIIKVI